MNHTPKYPIFFLCKALCYAGLLVFTLSSCSLSKNLNKTLGRIDSLPIKALTHAAGAGIMEGIDLNKLQTDVLLKGLLQDLDTLLNQELENVQIQRLQLRMTRALDSILMHVANDPVKFQALEGRVKTLLAQVFSGLQKEMNGVELQGLRQKLQADLALLRNELLGPETSTQLGKMFTTALDSVAQSGALVSIITKIDKVIETIDGKADKQITSLRRTINLLIWGAGAVVFLIMAYAFWQRRRMQQFKKLSLVLTKGVDQISSREDYDQIRDRINERADALQVRRNLVQLLTQHQGEYPVKEKYHQVNAERAWDLVQHALNGNQELRDKILAAAKTEPALHHFIEAKIKTKPSHN